MNGYVKWDRYQEPGESPRSGLSGREVPWEEGLGGGGLHTLPQITQRRAGSPPFRTCSTECPERHRGQGLISFCEANLLTA